jgi:hypothetical protein
LGRTFSQFAQAHSFFSVKPGHPERAVLFIPTDRSPSAKRERRDFAASG